MANQEHLAVLKQGVGVWNKWRQKNPAVFPDLKGADLRDADLMGANLREVYLTEADLTGALLSRADLFSADLRGAVLANAIMEYVNLVSGILESANLTCAHLTETNLSAANLKNANLTQAMLLNAELTEATLTGANLREACLQSAYLGGANFTGATLILADLSQADLSAANFYKADLSGANLRYTSLVGTNLMDANLAGCSVYGISVWDVFLEGSNQSGLIISGRNEPVITVDNLEFAQFIYLLLNHKKLRDILNTVTVRGVLLLGRFGGGGLELLQAVAEKLREIRYLPIIFDFDRPESRNLTETVMTLVGLSRFVIVDLSGPSVSNELRSTIPHFRIPFVPIIEEGRKVYSMFADFLENDWVLAPVAFTNKEHLLELLPSKVIEPAEMKCQQRQLRLKEIFDR